MGEALPVQCSLSSRLGIFGQPINKLKKKKKFVFQLLPATYISIFPHAGFEIGFVSTPLLGPRLLNPVITFDAIRSIEPLIH